MADDGSQKNHSSLVYSSIMTHHHKFSSMLTVWLCTPIRNIPFQKYRNQDKENIAFVRYMSFVMFHQTLFDSYSNQDENEFLFVCFLFIALSACISSLLFASLRNYDSLAHQTKQTLFPFFTGESKMRKHALNVSRN